VTRTDSWNLILAVLFTKRFDVHSLGGQKRVNEIVMAGSHDAIASGGIRNTVNFNV
jgi:hypothetical protein